ncbi:hypothetical protein GIY30_11965 [Gordonia sp. HNM0687]|uniref:Uncharacterized protein n=1 Tax=Gordonia mangrovi TaxID=2665643 RepID=A0A6L7GQ86_9ACTN|nr:hypothetical protein [Gordonia mangrovi]MXP22060.1 hypothetical protein [Gordonia mangrovi]UVF78015.1 hypothetical protein NWF22_22775 [Gordonia mangrovi]
MSATVLEPESDVDSGQAMPLVTLAGAGLTAWAAWQSAQHDWRPLWLYPPLLLVLMSGVIGLTALSVVGIRQRRGLKHVTTTLDRSHLVIGDDARLTVVTGAGPATAVRVDVHLEGREYTRTVEPKNVHSGSGGGWKQKERLIFRSRVARTVTPGRGRVDNLYFVVPSDIHPSVTDKPHGIDWLLRVRVKAGSVPGWEGLYPVSVRGRNGSGHNIDASIRSFEFPRRPRTPLPKQL